MKDNFYGKAYYRTKKDIEVRMVILDWRGKINDVIKSGGWIEQSETYAYRIGVSIEY